jgi:hypothetical protein
MDFSKIIEEIYDGGGGNYPAYNSPPRKDFAPISMRNGYDYPYQRGGAQEIDETPPDAPLSLPYPLNTVQTDLADAFVFTMTSAEKMVSCLRTNKALTKKQIDLIVDLHKKTMSALDLLKEVGVRIAGTNLAYDQPTQFPVPRSPQPNPESGSANDNTVVIKLP